MMGHRYLLDNNVLARLTPEERSLPFVQEHCRIPSEVLHEARFLPDADVLAELEYRTTGGVLRQLQLVMERVHVDDVRLVNLYSGQGSADPMLVACALDAVREADEGLFGDEWVIVSNDEAVLALAHEFRITTLTSNEFVVFFRREHDAVESR